MNLCIVDLTIIIKRIMNTIIIQTYLFIVFIHVAIIIATFSMWEGMFMNVLQTLVRINKPT